MQIKHSLKRHIIGSCILGAVALLVLATGGDTPAARAGQAAMPEPRGGRTMAAATPGQPAAATPTPANPGPQAKADAPAAMPATAQEQAMQRKLIQTERRVAYLRQQGGDENEVYRLRAAILPIAVVMELMERERAETRWPQARQGAAALPPLLPQLKQD